MPSRAYSVLPATRLPGGTGRRSSISTGMGRGDRLTQSAHPRSIEYSVELLPFGSPLLHKCNVLLHGQISSAKIHSHVTVIYFFGLGAAVIGFFHPAVEPSAQRFKDLLMAGVGGEVPYLPAIAAPLVEFLGWARGSKQQLLGERIERPGS